MRETQTESCAVVRMRAMLELLSQGLDNGLGLLYVTSRINERSRRVACMLQLYIAVRLLQPRVQAARHTYSSHYTNGNYSTEKSTLR